MAGHTNRVMSVSFSPDGRKWCLGGAMMIGRCVLVGCGSRVKRWERRCGAYELCLECVLQPGWSASGIWERG